MVIIILVLLTLLFLNLYLHERRNRYIKDHPQSLRDQFKRENDVK